MAGCLSDAIQAGTLGYTLSASTEREGHHYVLCHLSNAITPNNVNINVLKCIEVKMFSLQCSDTVGWATGRTCGM